MSVLRRGCSKMAVVAAAALHSALLAQLRILLPSRTVGQLWCLDLLSHSDAPIFFFFLSINNI